MKWDELTLIIFLLLFSALLMLRRVYVQRMQRRARAQYFSALKLSVLGTELNVGLPQETMRRRRQGKDFSAVPLLSKWLQRFWLNLKLLGWQSTWRKRAAMLFIPCFLVAVAVAKSATSPLLVSTGLSVGLFGALVMALYLRAMQRHLNEFRQNLPQAIDAIVRAARAGVPVSNTFAMVAENLPGPLAAEFLLIDNWLKVGIPLREAMRDSADRVPLNEYRFFVVILVINQETGGKLSDTLERLSDTLRERQELALKIKAKTSEVRASATIVALLAPLSLVYMYFNSPHDFEFLLNDPTGNNVLIYAACSVGLGLTITHYMIRRVIR